MTPSKTIPSLATQILTPETTAKLNAEFVHLIETRLRNSPGLKGMALRASVGVLTSAKPGILARGVEHLLPEFIAALQPLYTDYHKIAPDQARSGHGFGAYLMAHRQQATNAMTQLADTRSAASSNALYQRFYASMRGTIKQEADNFMPALAARIDAELQRRAELA